MQIGVYTIDTPIALVSMAGIIGKPFHRLRRAFGAGQAVGEMLHNDPAFRNTAKTLHRSNFGGEEGVVAAQIAGNDPWQMAEAVVYNVALGAQLIDINMGCPAKKVCNVQADSALTQNEPLVAVILEAVVGAAGISVALKTRLGWHDDHKNILIVARIAGELGIAAIAIHGHTRAQMYRGEASYELIAEAKGRPNTSVQVNGDITSPQKAAAVSRQAGADGVMIRYGAQGRPWPFRDLARHARHGVLPGVLNLRECGETVSVHVRAMHDFYGAAAGAKIARKHIGWYLDSMPEGEAVRREINRLDDTVAQYDAVAAYLDRLLELTDAWVCGYR